jgi:hypothetical protein
MAYDVMENEELMVLRTNSLFTLLYDYQNGAMHEQLYPKIIHCGV